MKVIVTSTTWNLWRAGTHYKPWTIHPFLLTMIHHFLAEFIRLGNRNGRACRGPVGMCFWVVSRISTWLTLSPLVRAVPGSIRRILILIQYRDKY